MCSAVIHTPQIVMSREVRPRRMPRRVRNESDDNSDQSSELSDVDYRVKAFDIYDDSDHGNEEWREFWRLRPNKIFSIVDGTITSFATKKCMFDPPGKPAGSENWFVTDTNELSIYPTYKDRLEILRAFQKNLNDNIPVRICLCRDGKMMDHGWMKPISISDQNIMVFRGTEMNDMPVPNETSCGMSTYDAATDHTYNSLKEMGWDRFMTHLEIPHLLEKDVPTFQTDIGPYTPDFIIYPNENKKRAIVEIKPEMPYTDQEAKMREVVEQTKMAGFILYGKHTLPYDNMQFRSDNPTYKHAKGARAIKYTWDARRRGVRRNEGYIWTKNDRCKPYLRRYQPFIHSKKGIGKFDWKHTDIIAAYEAATQATRGARTAA
jgi:hypothetical protein